jgi:hypothetical protein
MVHAPIVAVWIQRPASRQQHGPAICRFYGILIAMFFDDHGHPHFHARHSAQEVLASAELHRGRLRSGAPGPRVGHGDLARRC